MSTTPSGGLVQTDAERAAAFAPVATFTCWLRSLAEPEQRSVLAELLRAVPDATWNLLDQEPDRVRVLGPWIEAESGTAYRWSAAREITDAVLYVWSPQGPQGPLEWEYRDDEGTIADGECSAAATMQEALALVEKIAEADGWVLAGAAGDLAGVSDV